MPSLHTLLRTCTHDPRLLGGQIAVPFIALVAHTAVVTGIRRTWRSHRPSLLSWV